MGLKIAVQMDPLHGIDITGDSTFALMLEAQRRGHQLWHYEVQHMWLDGASLKARVQPVTVKNEPGAHYAFGPEKTVHLQEMDVVLMRQDPPFDMAYITATHFLETIHPKTLVVNNPFEVRNAPEKLFVTGFPGLQPPTLITSDPEALHDFHQRHGDMVLKPLYCGAGSGVPPTAMLERI